MQVIAVVTDMTQDVLKVDITQSHTPGTPRVLGGRSPMC